MAWVVTGPRSLELLSAYVEEELNEMSSDYDIRMEKSYIKWDNIRNAVSISVSNVAVINENEVVADFPELLFDFSIWRFLGGHLLSSDVTVLNPKFYINSAYETLYVKPEGTQEIQENFLTWLYGHLQNRENNFAVRSLRIKDADFFISNGQSDLVWHVSEGYARIGGYRKGKKIVSEFNINFGRVETSFDVDISHANEGLLDIAIGFRQLPSYAITDIFPKTIGFFERVSLISTGDINFLLSSKGTIPQLQFDIKRISGNLHFPEQFKEDITIKDFAGSGSFYEHFSSVTFDKLYADFNGPQVYLSGSVKNRKPFGEFLPDLKIEGTLANLAVENLENYWPIHLKDSLRDWITQNITLGKVIEGKGKFDFKAEDIEKILERGNSILEYPDSADWSPPIPDDAINASITIEGSRVAFHPSYPIINDVKSTVTFTGHTLTAKIKEAAFIGSKFHDGTVTIENMWQKPVVIKVQGDTDGRAEDLIKFFEPSQKNNKPNPVITSLYNTKGSGKGSFSVSVPIQKHILYPEIDLHIDAVFSDISLPRFYHNNDITDANFSLKIDNNKLQAQGNGVWGNLPLEFDYHQHIMGGKEYDIKYRIQAKPNVSDLALMDINLPFVQGGFDLDFVLLDKGETTKIKGHANIRDTEITIPPLHFNKPSKTKGDVTFSTIQKDKGPIEISNFSAKGKTFEASGSGQITADLKKITSLTLEKIAFDSNNLQARYRADETGFKLALKGKSMDLSAAGFTKAFRTTDTKKKKIEINADIDTVYMKNNEVLQNVNVNILCDTNLCQSVNLYGKIHTDNYVAMSMKPLGDRSALLVESDNAGAVINALGISKHIVGGELYIDSTFTKHTDDTTTALGVAHIRDFTAIKTPLLGKLLTLASFQGISDLLNQQGITFKKFEAPFEMSDGIIVIKEAKSSGSSVGITAEGVLDTNKEQVDFKGAIVPAYEFNKILGNIPVLGTLLVGKENEGVIATRYRVYGPYDDIKTSVNPLSILTPGFLRNIFDAFPNADGDASTPPGKR